MTLYRYRQALEGANIGDHPIPDEVRTRRIIELTGWTYDEIDAAPARRLDWLLAIANAEREVQAKANG